MKHLIYILLLTAVSCTVFPDDPYGHHQYPSGSESHGRRHEATAYSFTYLNAGYIKLGYASVFTFTDTDLSGSYDRVRIERFSLDDESRESHFGSTRYPNPYEARLNTELRHTNRR